MREINARGLEIITTFEGCKLEAYQCPAGIWTIGYGATGDGIVQGLVWDEKQCAERLLVDLTRIERAVERLTPATLSDNQFSAIVSLAYNIGYGNFRNSTLLRLVNSGSMVLASAEFLAWDKIAGKHSIGLARRRQSEMDLFLSRQC